MGALTPFQQRVLAVLRLLGPGEVVTYGDVAHDAGKPGAARAVGAFLSSSEGLDVPWWRVVASNGRLVPGHEREHAQLLRAEGVAVVDGKVRPAPGRAAPMPRPAPSAGRTRTAAGRARPSASAPPRRDDR